MKIVVLDGFVALNSLDAIREEFGILGELTVYDRTTTDLIIERAFGAEIVLTNKTPLSAETIEKLPGLKYIGVLATGYNVVDVSAASKHGIIVTNVPGYSTFSVAQLVFALLLELCHHTQRHSDSVKAGDWSRSEDFCYWNYPLTELAGKTMGIIGFGSIGTRVADIAVALGMNIMATKSRKGSPTSQGSFTWAEIPELLRKSDVISLHCPLTPETRGIINKNTLSVMKESAFLINTARGSLIIEEDLAAALNSGRIAGAGLDVLSEEPPNPGNPLLTAMNCLITPHIAWATKEARTQLLDIALQNLKAFLEGRPVNAVNGG